MNDYSGPDAAPAIIASDTGQRLDAIVRRHGGKPTPPIGSRMVLPAPKRGHRKGQLTLDDALDNDHE